MKAKYPPMVNQTQKNQKSNLALIANLFLLNTIFMLFTKEFDGIVGIDLSETSFNVIQINEDIRSNIYFTINALIFCILFRKSNVYLIRLAYSIAVIKFIYKLGMLLNFYEYNSGYSDYLSLGTMIFFMIYDKIKWKFLSDIYT